MTLFIPTNLMIKPSQASAAAPNPATTFYNPSAEALLRAVREAFNKKKRKPTMRFDSPRSGNC